MEAANGGRLSEELSVCINLHFVPMILELLHRSCIEAHGHFELLTVVTLQQLS